MNDPQSAAPSSEQVQTVFQKATGEVLAQRIEALALEIRGIGDRESLSFASTETLSALAMTLRLILKKIDDIFDFEGFVFTPACIMLLELFQARARGNVLSVTALCHSLNCPEIVGMRWLSMLEIKNLLEILYTDSDGSKVVLSEKGYLRTAEALQLLL